jgi:hypothetical protein
LKPQLLLSGQIAALALKVGPVGSAQEHAHMALLIMNKVEQLKSFQPSAMVVVHVLVNVHMMQ